MREQAESFWNVNSKSNNLRIGIRNSADQQRKTHALLASKRTVEHGQ